MKVSVIWVLVLVVVITLWVIWMQQRNITAQVKHLQIITTNPPLGKSLLPEQRRKFAREFEKKIKDNGMDATVTTTGDFHNTMLIQGNIINEPFVLGMKDNKVAIEDFREMGFKHIVMTNGRLSWDIDLKN